MLTPIDNFFMQHDEATNSCLQFLRSYLLSLSPRVSEAWKYGAPFYAINNKRFAYLWVHKKLKQPYIGIVDGFLINHNALLQEDRKRMKIMIIKKEEDINMEELNEVFEIVKRLYKK